MYFNLAIKNIRRSLKDYSIYFLTLILAITIFYCFNSINSQKEMMSLNSNQIFSFGMIDRIMNITSVFVSFILVFLMLYANNYLIKKRKKEFGVYMTLGMKRSSVSKILFYETLIVGILSLVIGLFIGIFLSQILTLFTAKLFKVNIIEFKFIFSTSASFKTLGCFILIYILVFIFNSIKLHKLTLIKLINASKKNDKVIKNAWVSVILFFISCLMIGSGYYIILDKGIAMIGTKNGFLAIALGSFGTLGFFFSLSGFLLKFFQRNKKFYLKELNSFVLRQISSKINSAFISMTFVCLMLFVAVCTLSAGFGINKGINDNIKDLTKFNISLMNSSKENTLNLLKEKGINLEDYSDNYVNVDYYESNIHYDDIITQSERKDLDNYYPIKTNQAIEIIKLSQLNKTLELLNKNPISINKNQYMILSDFEQIIKPLNKVLSSNKEIKINDKTLTPARDKVVNEVISIGTMKSNMAIIIVNDDIISNEKCNFSNLLIKDNKDLTTLTKKLDEVSKDNKNIYMHTKDEILNSSIGIAAGVSYLSLYLGFIFIIASALILAIQQLSEVNDNIPRYKLLTKIGVEKVMINKSLLVQIGIYFFIPLSLAIVHSIVGLKVSSNIIGLFGNINLLENIITSIGLLFLVYVSYFFATYLGAKNNIKGKFND